MAECCRLLVESDRNAVFNKIILGGREAHRHANSAHAPIRCTWQVCVNKRFPLDLPSSASAAGATMGKGGCAHSAEADTKNSWLGLKTIASAVTIITGNKWAEGSIAVKTGTSGKAAAVSEPRDQPILWDEVRNHATPNSCWIVVKSKVRCRGCLYRLTKA